MKDWILKCCWKNKTLSDSRVAIARVKTGIFSRYQQSYAELQTTFLRLARSQHNQTIPTNTIANSTKVRETGRESYVLSSKYRNIAENFNFSFVHVKKLNFSVLSKKVATDKVTSSSLVVVVVSSDFSFRTRRTSFVTRDKS